MNFILLMILMVSCQYKCINNSTIVEVGTCTKSGTCSYLDEKGQRGTTYLPIKGQQICTKWSSK